MRLNELQKYNKITIQCHDNPDADALGSGFALYSFFKDKGCDVSMIYSGRGPITKSNLKLMVEKLSIPVAFVEKDSIEKIEGLLLTTDCQYGAGNVTRFEAEDVAIIDHHQQEIFDVEKSLIITGMGSCSTVVWTMFKEENYVVEPNSDLATALYYGLLTDTNHFAEMNNPIDKDMRDELVYNRSLISMFINSNISIQELEVAGVAMLRCNVNEDLHFSVIQSKPCDANILGLISDFLLQVDRIFYCVVFNEVPGGFKLSVRSCMREVNAGELAAFICADMGSGGGHYQKAGGFFSKSLFEKKFPGQHAESYINNRMIEYFNTYELIYAGEYNADLTTMRKYQKKHIPLGFVKAADVLPLGTPIMVRTLEGDMDLTVEEDLIIMIGVKGEVYPNRMEKFQRAYKMISDTYEYEKCVVNNDYVPIIKSRLDGKVYNISDFAKTCTTTGDVQIYAKQLEGYVKVFTAWDMERYMTGNPGGYLAVRNDDLNDVYVVDQDIFDYTYEEV